MELITALLLNAYQFLASIKVPGFNISFIQLFFGGYAVVVSLGFAKMFFGLGGDVAHVAISSGRRSRQKSANQKGGNSKNLKIHDKRKGDTK